MTITVKFARVWAQFFQLQFGDLMDIEVRKTLDSYERAIKIEKPWRDTIPEEFRISEEWDLDRLQARLEEFELAFGPDN